MKILLSLFIVLAVSCASLTLEDVSLELKKIEPDYSGLIAEIAVAKTLGILPLEKREPIERLNREVKEAYVRARDALRLMDLQQAKIELDTMKKALQRHKAALEN